ncbi:PAAR domain-containing protein [Spirosoma daeguense]
MPPAARVGDWHTCPMVTPGLPPVPHVGGPVLPPGVPTVWIGGLPAATMGNMCVCVGPPDVIVRGSMGVYIGYRPAARMGDNTAHGGIITVGCPTVMIGEVGAPSGSALATPEMVITAQARDMTAASPETSRVKLNPGVIGSIVAQIQAAVGAAQSGSPYMEKCPSGNLVEGVKRAMEAAKANEEKPPSGNLVEGVKRAIEAAKANEEKPPSGSLVEGVKRAIEAAKANEEKPPSGNLVEGVKRAIEAAKANEEKRP